MSENLEFKISSGLKNIIGKDLITDDFIAVFELVKNSFDARAKNVEITIEEDKITVADNGKGMSLDELKNKWLFVAYSAKKDNTEDQEFKKQESYRDKIQERRHYAGAKGIGRFSSDRLGKYLTIKSKKKNLQNIQELQVDWSKFERDQNEIFEKVKVQHNELPTSIAKFPKNSPHGTILEITALHSSWSRERLIELKHSLEKLINPFSENNDFNIDMICERELNEDKNGLYKKGPNKGKKYTLRDKVNGPIKNAILDILELKTSQFILNISDNQIESKIIDRGELIYHILENSKFQIIEDLRIDLFFLNRVAKRNFTIKMGIQPVNFGSIFLFKNGFRVQPFGNTGDDSWGIDFRSQQGYNRFLGTRDLFGRVEVTSDNSDQFKEVSSRDGGLVETQGYYELVKAFELAHRRLERYVVGVLWGEGFKRRKYFGSNDEGKSKAEEYRKSLSEDKDSENLEIAKSNLGSKLDFIQIIKSLSNDKNIKILDFNKDFINLVNEKIDEVQTQFIDDLDTIAKKINDKDLKKKIYEIEKAYEKLKKEKKEAERKAEEEEKRRKEAEEKARKEEEARLEAEKNQKKEEEKRHKAELATLKKEKERAEAELAKLKAEKKAQEEQEKRQKEEEARIKAENEAARRKEQLTRHKAAETIEYKDLRDSNHIIGVYSDDISKKILLLKRKLDKGKKLNDKELFSFLQGISLANEKIATLTRFTTKSNFLKASLETKEDIVEYIINYIEKTYLVLHKINIEILNRDVSFIKKFQPIELSVVIDNILSNSRKKSAKKVIFDFKEDKGNLIISIKDVGLPLSETMDSKLIFEEGMTTTRGSGLGLNHVKRIVEDDLGGKIEHNPDYAKGFELKITLNK